MTYVFAPLQKALLPTLEESTKALQQADNDDPTSRDVRPLMATLMRLEDASPRLAGHILARRTALTSFDWEIVGAPSDAERDAISARLRSVIDRLIEAAVDVALYGAWAAVPSSEVVEGTHVIRIDREYDPDEIERSRGRGAKVQELRADKSGNVTRVDLPEGAWVMADRSRWVGGVLRRVLLREVMLNSSLKEWAAYLRKLKGIVRGEFLGEVPKPGTPDRLTAEAAMGGMMGENWAITSDQFKIVLDKVVEAASGASYVAFKAELEADVAIAVRGQAGTQQLREGTGSGKAALEVMQRTSDDIRDHDIRTAESLCQLALDLDYRLNVDQKATHAPYHLRIRIDQDEDAEANARATSEMLDALDGTGAGLLASEVYGRNGFTVPPGTPTIIKRSSTGGGPIPPPLPELG
ncbi:MAG: DUF935 family protein [Bacteroidetes bacterium]|nr:DUF935 family protein [Bacteroidota bacterium]